jgi:carboxyl-terminal processing protease
MRTVYGGGGIMPDCFVPVDTTSYTDYHKNIVAKGIINKFVLKYIDANRANLNNTYKNFTAFNNRFSITDAMMNELVETGKADGVECDEQQLAKAGPLIKVQLKALIARDLWGTSEFYQVMNSTDNSVMRALTILKNGDYERILSIANGD